MRFTPKYTITGKLLNNIKRITEIKTELNYRRFPHTVKVEIEKRAQVLSVFSSTSIEGNPLSLTEIKKVLKTKPTHIRDSEKEVLNYNKALGFLKQSVEKKQFEFNKKFILLLHSQVMQGLLPKNQLQRYRNTPVVVNNPKTGDVVYLSPDVKDVEKLMQALLDFVHDKQGEVDPILLAGIFHKQFVLIHPFIDGNGRTVRLLTKGLLANMGLNTFNLFSFENYYNKNVTRYFQSVGGYGDYYELVGSIDFTDWLEYFTDGIIDELSRVSKELLSFGLSPDTALKPNDNKILEHIQKFGFITDADYSNITIRAKATRVLDFDRLIKLGLIKRVGRGRSTHYVLS